MSSRPSINVKFIHFFGPAPIKGDQEEFNVDDFDDKEIKIGRNENCQLKFPPDKLRISRDHARVVRDGNLFKLINKSSNCTYVYGKGYNKQLEENEESYLKQADVIQFAKDGPKVSFQTAEIHHGAPSEEPKPPSLTIQCGVRLDTFKEFPVSIGKDLNCKFRIDNLAISDQHAQISFSQSKFWIKDLTGHKAVQINRHSIDCQETPLKHNDEVYMSSNGPLFRFIHQEDFCTLSSVEE